MKDKLNTWDALKILGPRASLAALMIFCGGAIPTKTKRLID